MMTRSIRSTVCAALGAMLLLMSGGAAGNCAVEVGYPETTPDTDFSDAGNGTVRHIPTGLVWKRCAEGQTWDGTTSTCTGSAAGYSWAQALTRAEDVNGGGAGTQNATQTDWRLPNINELTSITELGCFNPSINTTQFPNASASYFWSGSPFAGSSDYAWFVGFGDGYDYSFFRSVTQVTIPRQSRGLSCCEPLKAAKRGRLRGPYVWCHLAGGGLLP